MSTPNQARRRSRQAHPPRSADQQSLPIKQAPTPAIPTQSERTFQMKEQFMTLHEQNLSIKEIAYRFNLSTYTVYSHLQEIADRAGVARESLLQIPHSQHVTYERKYAPVQPVDLTNFNHQFHDTLTQFDQLLKTCGAAISTHEIAAMNIEMEEAQW